MLTELGAATLYFVKAPISNCPTPMNFGNILVESYAAAGYNLTPIFTFSTFDTAPLQTGLEKYYGQEFSYE